MDKRIAESFDAQASWNRAMEIIEGGASKDMWVLANRVTAMLRLGKIEEGQPLAQQLLDLGFGLRVSSTPAG